MPIKYDTKSRIHALCYNVFPSILRDATEPIDGMNPFTKQEAYELLGRYRDKGYVLAQKEETPESYTIQLDKCYEVYKQLIDEIPVKKEL